MRVEEEEEGGKGAWLGVEVGGAESCAVDWSVSVIEEKRFGGKKGGKGFWAHVSQPIRSVLSRDKDLVL